MLKHPINVVARLSGLSPHVIRIWERRYGAVAPERSAGNRRLYGDEDIRRLQLLKRVVDAGHSIGQVAGLSDNELIDLLQRVEGPVDRAREPESEAGQTALHALTAATLSLDAEALEAGLLAAKRRHTVPVLLEHVVAPFLDWVGREWRVGRLNVANEHLASDCVKSFLNGLRQSYIPGHDAPLLVATTPAGQWHELGALMAAVAGAAEGWQSTYLGPNLPADEIAGAADALGARVVALSVVYPPADPLLIDELRRLRKYLAPQVVLAVGGRGAAAAASDIEAAGATYVDSTDRLRLVLARLVPSNGAAPGCAPL